MAAINDIVDLASQLESRVKDRSDIDVLRQIYSLVSAVQTQHVEIVERDIRVLQENARLMQEKAEIEKELVNAKSEQVVIYKGIEFRKGARTLGKWAAFCPKCHLPAQDAWVAVAFESNKQKVISCTARCEWRILMAQPVNELINDLSISQLRQT